MHPLAITIIGSIVRWGTTAAGVWLTTKGYITPEQATSVTATAVGGAVAIAPLVWGVVQKVVAEKKTQAREVTAVQAGATLPKDSTIAPAAVPAVIEEYKVTGTVNPDTAAGG